MFRVRTDLTGGAGGAQVSTMYFSSFPGRTADAAAAAVGAFWYALKANISTDYSWTTEPEVYTMLDSTGEVTGTTTVTSYTDNGTAAGDPLPWMTQGLVRWNTGLYAGGRLIRGRTFIPGAVEGANASGVPTTAYKDTTDVAISQLLANTAAELVVWSRKNADTYPAIGGSIGTTWAFLSSRRS